VVEQEKGDTRIQSLALTKGIRGWAEAGSLYTDRMSEFEASFWQDEGAGPA
jgi:hypothetical protein